MPGRIEYSELPKRARKQVRSLLAGGGGREVVRPVESTPRHTADDRIAWCCTRCGTCGDTLAGLERHAENSRHYRYDTLR
jgi:hypothetical protein